MQFRMNAIKQFKIPHHIRRPPTRDSRERVKENRVLSQPKRKAIVDPNQRVQEINREVAVTIKYFRPIGGVLLVLVTLPSLSRNRCGKKNWSPITDQLSAKRRSAVRI